MPEAVARADHDQEPGRASWATLQRLVHAQFEPSWSFDELLPVTLAKLEPEHAVSDLGALFVFEHPQSESHGPAPPLAVFDRLHQPPHDAALAIPLLDPYRLDV